MKPYEGQAVLFHPAIRGKPMQAVVKTTMGNGTVELIVGSDPFPITARTDQIESLGVANRNGSDITSPKIRKLRSKRKGKKKMAEATAEKLSAKELRQQAQGLGIKNWQEMGRKELKAAIKEAGKNGKVEKAKPKIEAVVESESEAKPVRKARKAKPASKPKATTTKPRTKKAAAKKSTKATTKKVKAESTNGTKDGLSFAKTHPKATPAHGENPFRKQSARFKVAKLLLKGGKRENLAHKLSEQVALHPYQKADNDIDLLDFDKRLLLSAQTMRDEYGYGIYRTGRGLDGTILVFVPGGPSDPREKKTKKK